VVDCSTGGRGGLAAMKGRYSHAAAANIIAQSRIVSGQNDFTGADRAGGLVPGLRKASAPAV
jgi:hypothetical protein